MAFQFTLPTLLGVIIGGVAFFFCLAVALVVLVLRIKHHRKLARTNAAGERRLSRYPGGHLSITDEDVAQMPGTGTAMRESLCNRYTRTSTYAPMASRESVEPQFSESPMLYAPAKDADSLQKKTPVPEPGSISASPVRAWPMPRRLTRASRPPAIHVRLPPPTSAASGHRSAEPPKLTPRDEFARDRGLSPFDDGRDVVEASPEKSAIPSPTLQPKPLFHEKKRSISHGMIADSHRQGEIGPTRLDHESHNSWTHSRSSLPRSISLTSQGPGRIPIEPVPPLPAEALAIRRQRSRNASGSRRSLITTNSRQDVDGGLRIDTIPTKATSHTIVKTPKSSEERVNEDQFFVDGNMFRPPVSPTVVRSEKSKTRLDSQKSFRASIQDGITRSNSSGLSESLLNHGWSRSASNASMLKEVTYAGSKTPASTNSRAHISVFDFGLPFRSDAELSAMSQTDPNESQTKRKSTSILQMISGNEQTLSLGAKEGRPTSIATEIPFRWSNDVLTKEMSEKGETAKELAKARPTSKRSSIKQQYAHASRASRSSSGVQKAKLPATHSQPQAQSLRRPRIDPPAFRPPSKPTFDPQLTGTLRSKRPSARVAPGPNSHLKDTLAILTGQNDSDSSTSSPPPTPTRRPSQKRQPSGTHPNRQRAIFDGPSKIAQWPLAGQHPALSLGLRAANDEASEKANNIFRLDAQINSTKDSKKSINDEDGEKSTTLTYRPPSLLYRFPSPPSPPVRNASNSGGGVSIHQQLQSHSQPYIQVPYLNRPIFLSHSDAYSKTTSNLDSFISDNHRNDKENNGSPSNQLRQSVLALRRMNSEISEPSTARREHRRYLSLGKGEDAIFEDGDDGTGRIDRGIMQRMESTSTVTTVLDAPAPLSVTSKRRDEQLERENMTGERAMVKGPRAMPGWLDESMMISSPSSYAPTAAGAEHEGRSWLEGEQFSKLF